ERAGILRIALNDTKNLEQNGILAILRLVLGAGVTPAQGGAEPTVGSAFNQVHSLLSPPCQELFFARPRPSDIFLSCPPLSTTSILRSARGSSGASRRPRAR